MAMTNYPEKLRSYHGAANLGYLERDLTSRVGRALEETLFAGGARPSEVGLERGTDSERSGRTYVNAGRG